MFRQLILISSFLLIVSNNLFASDTTKYRITVFGGLTNNTVYGTMVNRNNQFNTDVKMENRVGFAAGVNIEKSLTKTLFLKTGLNFVLKQVDPMVNTSSIYKDKLKTGYISIPIEVGMGTIQLNKPVNVAFLIGTMTNIRLTDKSESGPDRAGFKTSFVSESISAGTRISINTSSKFKFILQYNYLCDLSNAYVETLYYYGGGSTTKFYYKYKTHLISIGLQFPLRK